MSIVRVLLEAAVQNGKMENRRFKRIFGGVIV